MRTIPVVFDSRFEGYASFLRRWWTIYFQIKLVVFWGSRGSVVPNFFSWLTLWFQKECSWGVRCGYDDTYLIYLRWNHLMVSTAFQYHFLVIWWSDPVLSTWDPLDWICPRWCTPETFYLTITNRGTIGCTSVCVVFCLAPRRILCQWILLPNCVGGGYLGSPLLHIRELPFYPFPKSG